LTDTASCCPICGSADTRSARSDVLDLEYFVVPERPLLHRACLDCASEYLHPRPTEAEIRSFYPADYHAYHEDHGAVASLLVGMRARLRGRYYRRLLGNRPGRLFDVGAGDCRHFDELARFCELEFGGVELQPEIAARARKRGYDVVPGTLETLNLEGHEAAWDVVSMNHIIEHVIEPRRMVERAHRLLRPGGWVVGQLPALDSWESRLFGRRWGGYHYPRHLQAFSRRGLRRILESAGFVDVRVKSTPHIQTAVSLQNALVGAGWRPTLRYGKTPAYGLLMLAALPFETLQWLCSRSGIVDFEARRSD